MWLQGEGDRVLQESIFALYMRVGSKSIYSVLNDCDWLRCVRLFKVECGVSILCCVVVR